MNFKELESDYLKAAKAGYDGLGVKMKDAHHNDALSASSLLVEPVSRLTKDSCFGIGMMPEQKASYPHVFLDNANGCSSVIWESTPPKKRPLIFMRELTLDDYKRNFLQLVDQMHVKSQPKIAPNAIDGKLSLEKAPDVGHATDLLCERKPSRDDVQADLTLPSLVVNPVSAPLETSDDPNQLAFAEQWKIIQNSNGLVQIYILEELQTGQLVGCASLILEPKFYAKLGKRTSWVAHIEDVVIDVAYRGKKIGAFIIEQLCKIAKEKQCYKIILDCNDENKRFYEKLGFQHKENHMSIYL